MQKIEKYSLNGLGPCKSVYMCVPIFMYYTCAVHVHTHIHMPAGIDRCLTSLVHQGTFLIPRDLEIA